MPRETYNELKEIVIRTKTEEVQERLEYYEEAVAIRMSRKNMKKSTIENIYYANIVSIVARTELIKRKHC
jgi:hypothetical protein